MFYGKLLENARNRRKDDPIKKDNNEKFIKQQSKLTFNGIHKSYIDYDSYKFRQNEALMDKPNSLELAKTELSRLYMYESY